MMTKYDKKISLAILISFFISILLCVFFLDDAASYLKDSEYAEVANANKGDLIKNPLSLQYKKIKSEYNVDFDVAEKVRVEPSKGHSFRDFPLFLEEEKSLDLLFIGDSSLAWGFRPDIFKAVTGLETGVFTYEAQLLNKANVALYKALAQCFLKPNGKLILSFALGTQTADPNITNLPHLKVYEDDLIEANKAIEENNFCQSFRSQTHKQESKNLSEDAEDIELSLDTIFSFNDYQNLLDQWREDLKSKGMALPKVSFYQDKILKYINPAWEAVLNQGQQNKLLKLMEHPDSITLYYPEVEYYAPQGPIGRQVNMSRFKPEEALTENAPAIIEGLSEVRNVVYLIPLSVYPKGRLPRARSFYQYFYKDSFGLVDMHYHFESKRLPPIPMQFGHHPLNEGGVIQTLEIADAINQLKSNWDKPARDFRNVILKEQ